MDMGPRVAFLKEETFFVHACYLLLLRALAARSMVRKIVVDRSSEFAPGRLNEGCREQRLFEIDLRRGLRTLLVWAWSCYGCIVSDGLGFAGLKLKLIGAGSFGSGWKYHMQSLEYTIINRRHLQ
jgi:hypothetical protein